MKGKKVPRRAIGEIAGILNKAGVDERLVQVVISALQSWPPNTDDQKIFRAGIQREVGRLYIVNREGNVVSIEQEMVLDEETGMLETGDPVPNVPPRLEVELKIKRKPGMLYFVDAEGDVCAAPLSLRR